MTITLLALAFTRSQAPASLPLSSRMEYNESMTTNKKNNQLADELSKVLFVV